jgi:hypothetical protein
MSISGTWNLTIDTPMGKQESVVQLNEADGALTGTATGAGETVEIFDGSVDGNTATWKVKITKPLSLTVTLTATFTDDELSGKAKAGMFPASNVTGVRA